MEMRDHRCETYLIQNLCTIFHLVLQFQNFLPFFLNFLLCYSSISVFNHTYQQSRNQEIILANQNINESKFLIILKILCSLFFFKFLASIWEQLKKSISLNLIKIKLKFDYDLTTYYKSLDFLETTIVF